MGLTDTILLSIRVLKKKYDNLGLLLKNNMLPMNTTPSLVVRLGIKSKTESLVACHAQYTIRNYTICIQNFGHMESKISNELVVNSHPSVIPYSVSSAIFATFPIALQVCSHSLSKKGV